MFLGVIKVADHEYDIHLSIFDTVTKIWHNLPRFKKYKKIIRMGKNGKHVTKS